MEIQHLRYFYEVAKQGSFSKASKTLRVSQPSVSKMVRLLEHTEGYTFLDREKKGVKLTPMGKLLFDRCERIFAEFEGLKFSLNNRKQECQGELWLGASDNICNYVLPDILEEFLKEYPRVQVKLYAGVASQIVRELKEFQLELGMFYTPQKESSLLFEELCQVDYAIVASPSFPLKRFNAKKLTQLPYVGSRAVDYTKCYPTFVMLRSLKVEPTTIIETNQQETQKRLAMAGLGYSVMPRHMVREELASGALVDLKPPKPIHWTMYLARRKNRTLSQVALRWESHLKARVKSTTSH